MVKPCLFDGLPGAMCTPERRARFPTVCGNCGHNPERCPNCGARQPHYGVLSDLKGAVDGQSFGCVKCGYECEGMTVRTRVAGILRRIAHYRR
jgi:hypothetical protein